MDYLDDPSRGKFGGVILINEAERMPQEAWERLMEMLDVGEVAGGDGKTRKLKRHLVILTSNRIDKTVFPSGIERLSDFEMNQHLLSFDNDKLREIYKQKSSGKDEFILPDPIIARVDRWSLAKPITLGMAKVIARKISEKTVSKLQDRFGIKVTIDASAADSMAERSFQYGMGARPVIKSTQGLLQKLITQAVSQTGSDPEQTIHISTTGGELKATLSQGREVALALPKAQNIDPLDDPEFALKMKSILPTLRERVIGQDEATKAVAQAIIAHLSDPEAAKRPTALFLVGSTGTGKTSMARALAKALYKNEDRAEVIDLGRVNFEGGLNDVFGSRKGYIGSQDRAAFEEILLRNPEGGVIVFDEASNMGGEDKARKNALFKQGFYSLLEEGKWTSSATGTTYDLSKYIFMFNGNDGEKLFQGVNSDDLRMVTYNKNKERSKTQKILIDAGIPEAFLGRMIDVILMKPLLSTDIEKITQGMLRDTLKSYQDRGIKFEVDSEFSKRVSKAFFSHDQGARSIRSMLDSDFKATLANLIVQAGGLQSLKGQTIKIVLNDTLSARPYAIRGERQREVSLSLEVSDGGGQLRETITSDLTTKATHVDKQSFIDARALAFNQAGHAIVNEPNFTGERLALLTITGSGTSYGRARYEESPLARRAITREVLVAKVAAILAGPRAQQMDGQVNDLNWSTDIKRAREYVSHNVLEYSLVPELRGVVTRGGQPHLTNHQVQILSQTVEMILNDGDAKAQSILKDKWPLVRDVSARLLKQGSVSGLEFDQLANQSLLPANKSRAPKNIKKNCEALLAGVSL